MELGDIAIAIHQLEQTGSTNSWLREHTDDLDMSLLFNVAVTGYQSAGRGQKGNSWESARDENLLFSILACPLFVDASRQFCLSEAIALAVTDAIAPLLGEKASDLSVKWPNDIYWREKKLAGILIENRIQGSHLSECIIGVGLNVNQPEFYSDAPNPVSIRNITGACADRDDLLADILSNMASYYTRIQAGESDQIHRQYMRRLFRRDGLHPYRDGNGMFNAAIESVMPNGIIILRDENGTERRYEFKQVGFILNNY